MQIVGEPGLGKSRLIEEFRTRLAETPHTWVEWASSQLLQNTPLHPIAEWGRQRFRRRRRALAELEAALAQVKLDPAEHAPLLAPLLDIPLPEARAPKLAAEELRRRQLAAVVAWLLAGARAQPLVLAFEDLHWADPTTLDLMKTLAERGGASAAADRRDGAAGVPRAVGDALASQRHFASSARPRADRSDGRRHRRAACAVRRTSSRAWATAPAACPCSSRR